MKKILITLIIIFGIHGLFIPVIHGENVPGIRVSAGQPQLVLNRSELYFGVVSGGAGSDSQTFLVSNGGDGTLNWILARNTNWVSYSPEFGGNSNIVTVTVNPAGLAPGLHSATLAVSDLNASNSPQFVDVYLHVYSSGHTAKPFGDFAVPEDNSIVSGSVPLTGWALDDIGVVGVKLYRLDGPELIYFGDAVFVEGARPDVETAYPGYPNNYKAGWGYMLLTNFLPNGGNGTFAFYAAAVDKEGNQTVIGTRTITCDNANAVKPFGTIDTPAQGDTVSGTAYRNHGWVLTPMPNKIPEDGSTIEVYIDSVKVGHPVYNNYREDIAQLFPDYANSNGAHGYFDFDTTAYSNGVHTIVWTARDNAGNSEGIGSRYFTVDNSAVNRPPSVVNRQWSREEIPLDITAPAAFIKGFDRTREPQPLYPGERGNVDIELKPLEPLEIHLGRFGISSTCSGYSVVGERLGPLPIGSTLDSHRGVFRWIPCAGFSGEHRLIFLTNENGHIKEIQLTVRVI